MQKDESSLWAILAPFLFFGAVSCAVFSGAAYLYILYFSPQPFDGVVLQPGVDYVTARRFETHGLETLRSGDAGIELIPLSETALASKPAQAVTILVHGYNAQEHKVAAYFTDLATYLLTESRYDGTLLVFDWPAVGIPFDELPTSQRIQIEMQSGNRPMQPGYELAMYGADQRNAADIGARSFLALLDAVSKTHAPAPITVIGHSMGCYLLAEALRRDPALASKIASMIWLAPDVGEAVLDEEWSMQRWMRCRRAFPFTTRPATRFSPASRVWPTDEPGWERRVPAPATSCPAS